MVLLLGNVEFQHAGLDVEHHHRLVPGVDQLATDVRLGGLVVGGGGDAGGVGGVLRHLLLDPLQERHVLGHVEEVEAGQDVLEVYADVLDLAVEHVVGDTVGLVEVEHGQQFFIHHLLVHEQ